MARQDPDGAHHHPLHRGHPDRQERSRTQYCFLADESCSGRRHPGSHPDARRKDRVHGAQSRRRRHLLAHLPAPLHRRCGTGRVARKRVHDRAALDQARDEQFEGACSWALQRCRQRDKCVPCLTFLRRDIHMFTQLLSERTAPRKRSRRSCSSGWTSTAECTSCTRTSTGRPLLDAVRPCVIGKPLPHRWISARMDFIGTVFATSLAVYLVYASSLSASDTGFSLNMASAFVPVSRARAW